MDNKIEIVQSQDIILDMLINLIKKCIQKPKYGELRVGCRYIKFNEIEICWYTHLTTLVLLYFCINVSKGIICLLRRGFIENNQGMFNENMLGHRQKAMKVH